MIVCCNDKHLSLSQLLVLSFLVLQIKLTLGNVSIVTSGTHRPMYIVHRDLGMGSPCVRIEVYLYVCIARGNSYSEANLLFGQAGSVSMGQRNHTQQKLCKF